MNRYQFAGSLGALFVAVALAIFALAPPHTLSMTTQITALGVAGVLFVLSGVENPLRHRVGPHRLMGAGNVVLGASLAAGSVADGLGDGEWVYVAASVLGGITLAAIGLAYVFSPTHFGLDEDGYPVR